jgi:hypothetical protein
MWKKLKELYWRYRYLNNPHTSILDIVHNENTTTEHLDLIFEKYKSRDYVCSSALSRHPNTSSKVLEEISNIPDGWYSDWTIHSLHYWIVVHPNVTLKALENIAPSDCEFVRHKIKQNPKCTEDLALLIKAYEFKRNLP